ncbi:AAA family ATPase [Methylobacterium sp. 13MFTsu3.1M2]|uniref:AAA family ATPase n=1 Tax=Methylobacterium sp. 13MFTsu3.1M2 TaxID=1502776 RepID=UPI0008E9B97D|nr:AAA family ATPase [Methylobacterium sp. 13MFTsu3.1M2]SFD82192.1 Predicted kinase [Methylobacterium sp. 13MFTsu3.1M2]
MLVVLGGLPGAGKTTLGKALAVKRSAAYVRVDEIEHALTRRAKLGPDIGAAGYIVAFAVAASNLRLGNLVIADSVNPVPESREGWRDVAHREAVRLIEIEVICSDEAEHRRRVETRTADIVGFKLPSWSSVMGRDYVPWSSLRLVVDTALLAPDEAVAVVEAEIDAMSGRASLTS